MVTPNLMEAQALTGLDTEDRRRLAEALVALGAGAALVTGGHGSEPVDHLLADGRHLQIPVARHPVAATHGAGCTHSAALAACLGRGDPLPVAARRAALVAGQAVEHGLAGLGAGDGPVDALHIAAFSRRTCRLTGHGPAQPGVSRQQTAAGSPAPTSGASSGRAASRDRVSASRNQRESPARSGLPRSGPRHRLIEPPITSWSAPNRSSHGPSTSPSTLKARCERPRPRPGHRPGPARRSP